MKEKIDGKTRGQDMMDVLQEQENKISSVTTENEVMQAYIRDLEYRLDKNSVVNLDDFKEGVSSDCYLKQQIESLNIEIGLLQSSIKKALNK